MTIWGVFICNSRAGGNPGPWVFRFLLPFFIFRIGILLSVFATTGYALDEFSGHKGYIKILSTRLCEMGAWWEF